MLKFFKRWLGWDSDSAGFDIGDVRVARRPPTPHAPRAPVALRPDAPTRSPPPVQPGAVLGQPQSAAPKRLAKERDPLEVLDDPGLTLDRPTNDGFDPYNTGAFNRSASWERIGRHKR